MNGQVKSPRERLTGLGTSTSNWFASLIPPEQIAGMPDILHVTEETHQHQLNESVLATEVDSKVKTKLLTMWNNVKYGWASKIKTNFSKESPVWLLGSCYYKKPEEALSLDKASEAGLDPDSSGDESLAEDATIMDEGMDGFKRDFVSRLWLTYRKEFPILNGSTYTTDCGWGCMLRSGQMMLAQALVCHFLGRDWRWRPDQKDEIYLQDEAKHRMIIKWFGDQPTEQTPLSIHTLVKFGASAGKRAGDWYGPASVAHLLSQAVKDAALRHEQFENLALYVAQDCAVYLEDVRKACEKSDGSWKSLILLVPLRLGADKLNPNYAPCLTALLQLDVCIGVIGGRPRHSLYFIGYQEDKLIHLDPHYCQEAVDVWKDNFPLASFHCSSPRKMLLSKMDPSCCVGFYFCDKQAFDKFVMTIERSLVPSNQKVDYPMFLFCEGSGDEIRRGYEVTEDMMATSTSANPEQFAVDELPYECEEFEVL
ncbi:cysteine protease atg4da [Microplitis demolitor]|uniref:cysteine protease atg4da n=1 Tax=Microplitis demolitor TaxID=69319 RepID=UPI0004CD80AF|nr:cysteine protease atg4da [Microplitis demolitor]